MEHFHTRKVRGTSNLPLVDLQLPVWAGNQEKNPLRRRRKPNLWIGQTEKWKSKPFLKSNRSFWLSKRRFPTFSTPASPRLWTAPFVSLPLPGQVVRQLNQRFQAAAFSPGVKAAVRQHSGAAAAAELMQAPDSTCAPLWARLTCSVISTV